MIEVLDWIIKDPMRTLLVAGLILCFRPVRCTVNINNKKD